MFTIDEYGYEIFDESVRDQTIELGKTKYIEKVYDAVFHNCIFITHQIEHFRAGNCEFYNCEFRPKKRLESSIRDNYWENCRFFGEFRGTNFGCAMEYVDKPTRWPEIALKSCDFSKATMSGCGIMRLDIPTTIFPVWPCFSILHPHENLQRWLDAKLPFQSRFYQYSSSPGLSAEMYHWPSMVKWYKINPVPDPEDVRSALSKLDFIRL